MSLINALIAAQSGITQAEKQLSVASFNIQNADREGYTRKSWETSFITTDGVTLPIDGEILGTINTFLSREVVGQNSNVSFYNIINEYMLQYDFAIGSTAGNNNISSALDDLLTMIDSVSVSPENTSEKLNVIAAAEELAYQLNRQSDAIQTFRQQADQGIDRTVDLANALLIEIDDYNEDIINAEARGINTADLIDERNYAVQELAGLMNIQYHTTDEGRIQIYTSSGDLLLGSTPHTMLFDPSGAFDATATYPAVLNGITVDGNDITADMRSGEIGAYLDLRDTAFVQEQAKLDEFANQLVDELNRLHNQGASVPPPPSLTGASGFAAGDAIAGAPTLATGTMRVASTDVDGNVLEVLDINLAGIATVGDLVTAIDGMANIDAVLNANGQIVITSTNPANGVSISEMDSDTQPDNDGISHFLGLNGLFDPDTTGAQDIAVVSQLLTNPEYFAVGQLSQAGGLAVGDPGVLPGDATIAQAMADLFSTNISFNAAGELVAQNDTFQGYVSSVLSSAAVRVHAAESDLDGAEVEYNAVYNALTSYSGINIDEELTKIAVIEDAYQASAQIISVIQEMFDTLLQAVR